MLENKSILIVDDDPDLQDFVSEALRIENHEVYQANNGQEALDLLLSLRSDQLPCCIILDLMMPVMDGMSFMDIMQSRYHEKFGHIPIIVSSAKGSLMPDPVHSRAQVKLNKPFDLDKLYSTVNKFCSHEN